MTQKSGFNSLELTIIFVIVGLATGSIVLGVQMLNNMPDETSTTDVVLLEGQGGTTSEQAVLTGADDNDTSLQTSIAPTLALPVECELGKNCFIQNYVDHDETDLATDFTCGNLTYDGHKGTDFALHGFEQMQSGVSVLAAASGTVIGMRNGMEDREMNSVSPKVIKNRECGNGVVLDHGEGWQTQYCHMKKDSLIVKKGDYVSKGQTIGEIGLSGKTEFPHLHISLRHNDVHVDPFTAQPMNSACSLAKPNKTLWEEDVANMLNYSPTGYVASGFIDDVPDMSNILVRKKKKDIIAATAPKLIFWTELYGVKAGDELTMRITSASGEELAKMTDKIKADKVRYFKFIGKKNRTQMLNGDYKSDYVLMRQGKAIVKGTDVVEVRR